MVVEPFHKLHKNPNMLEISAIPIYSDNYVWVLWQNSTAWVVDPGDAAPVIAALTARSLTLEGILITHHHWDHITGVAPLLNYYGHQTIPVIGPAHPSFQLVTQSVHEGDSIAIFDSQIQVLAIPGHTLDHLGYYLQEEQALLCGDTLFSGGCGRLFDGSMEQLYNSLMRLKTLPATTEVYCTHEYTLANLAFAVEVEPNNERLTQYRLHCQQLRAQGKTTLPSNLGLECQINPFLRSHLGSVQETVKKRAAGLLTDEFSYFRALREWKNRY